MFFKGKAQTNYLTGAKEALLCVSVTWSTSACSEDVFKYNYVSGMLDNTTQAANPV